MDKDLQSVAQVRELLKKAEEAQCQLAEKSQQELDNIIKSIAEAGEKNAAVLGEMACKETGFGNSEDKKIKNIFASKTLFESVKDIKAKGILNVDEKNKITDIGAPVGVITGIIPTTNPTSAVIYKSIIALKGGNAIVFSPHPGALKCILETVRIVSEAAKAAGCPDGAVSCISIPTLEATKELMRHKITKLILATGGPSMVKSAYSSGTPAIGVGAGNGPAFIDKSADVPAAIKRIIQSKTFDNGTICASEQSIIIEKCMEPAVKKALADEKAYLLCGSEAEVLGKYILRENGSMNPAIVGKKAVDIAKLAGLKNVPEDTSVLVARETRVGMQAPYSHEKLAPILALFVEENLDRVLERCIEILMFEGAGHTFCIHAEDKGIIEKFALKIPASRILVNTPGSLGGVGATTNLLPAFTLGCGAVGGSSSSNNIGPLDLINIKRVAVGTKELGEIKENKREIDEKTLEALVQSIIKKLV